MIKSMKVAGNTAVWGVLLLFAADRQAPVDQAVTAEQLEILKHMSIVMLDDGMGGLVKTIRFSKINLQVVSGLGATNGNSGNPLSLVDTTTNGLGNLIVGYGESPALPFQRTGSHNLVIGPLHSYSSFGGLVAGRQNNTEGPHSSVSGGLNNTVSSVSGSVSGGFSNHVLSQLGSISGGHGNAVEGPMGSVSGGFQCVAQGQSSWVGGGWANGAGGEYACASGGTWNQASGRLSSVTGGEGNESGGELSTVSSGRFRSVAGPHDWRAGGLFQDN